MRYLNVNDWLIIACYLAGILLFGLWFGRGQKSTRDYFLGSRNIPWWGVGLSIIASETSAITFLSIPAQAYDQDWAFLQIILGYVIARFVLAIVMVPHYLRGEIYSPYQLLTQTFGPAAGRTAGAFFLLSGTLAAGVRVYVTCIPIKLMLDVSMLTAILVFVGLSLAYTYVGGIKAVIWTDVVQFVLFVAGGLATIGYICGRVDGGLFGSLGRADAAGKLHWLNLKCSGALPYNLWMGLLGATAQVLSSHGANQLIVQRVLSCKSVADGRKALVLSALIILPLFALFLLTGTLLWAYYQQYTLPLALPADQAGFKQIDYIFPIFIMTALPHLLKGFLIVALFSAAMSSVSSAMSALASVSTMDFVRGYVWRERSEAFYFRFSQYSTAFWAFMLVLVAYASRHVTVVLDWAFLLNGLTSGAMLGGVWLAVTRRQEGPWPVVVGMVGSLAGMTVIALVAPKTIAWPWYTLIGTVLTLGLAAAVRRGFQKHPPSVMRDP